MNSQEDGWVFWDQPLDKAKSLLLFLAAEAARDQGEEVFQAFLLSLLTRIHGDEKMPVEARETLLAAAEQVPDLDREPWERTLQLPELRARIGEDYREAVENFGIFGTPTLRFDEGDPVFLKMAPPPKDDEAVSLFQSVRTYSLQRPYIRELKKPRPPERKA